MLSHDFLQRDNIPAKLRSLVDHLEAAFRNGAETAASAAV
jgi:hypothetical protein